MSKQTCFSSHLHIYITLMYNHYTLQLTVELYLNDICTWIAMYSKAPNTAVTKMRYGFFSVTSSIFHQMYFFSNINIVILAISQSAIYHPQIIVYLMSNIFYRRQMCAIKKCADWSHYVWSTTARTLVL